MAIGDLNSSKHCLRLEYNELDCERHLVKSNFVILFMLLAVRP